MGGRGRVKRQQVEADDGWTVITHGLSTLSVAGKRGRGKNQKHNAALARSMPSDTVEGMTAEKILQDFNNRTEKWETTACAQHVQTVLAKGGWHIREAVCIGIGSFSRDWEHRHRAMWQLVLFMSVVSHLRKTTPEVKLYVQEPAFTPLDHAFLSLLDISVCVDDIQTHISPRSFVFSPFVDWYLLLPVFLKDKHPVLYVGNEILDDYGSYAQSEEKKQKLEDCNLMGKKWLEKRIMMKLKEFEMHPHALNGMVVYWVVEEENEENVVRDTPAKADEGRKEVVEEDVEIKGEMRTEEQEATPQPSTDSKSERAEDLEG